MRVANLAGRLVLIEGELALDVETASGGRLPAEPQRVFEAWPSFLAWAAGQSVMEAGAPFEHEQLGPCVPRPPQVFAIGLNYANHADESGFAVPDDPVVFTKFPSSITGPDVEVGLSGDRVDWEAELVVVIGVGGRRIAEADAWGHVAGLTVGQDLSDRTVQFWGDPPQFSLGKSMAGYAPIGPWLVTPDEIAADREISDLGIECVLTEADGRQRVLQSGRTQDMIFPVPAILARLSAIVELLPGDLVFTGTPAGVGVGRTPPEFLRPGQSLTTSIEGIGSIRQRFTRG